LVRRPLTDLSYPPRMIDDGCGAVGGMGIGRGNQSTRGKPAPVPLRPPQIPHNLTWVRKPSRSGGRLSTNRLSYGTASGAVVAVRTGRGNRRTRRKPASVPLCP
jgi:hypothetical protein